MKTNWIVINLLAFFLCVASVAGVLAEQKSGEEPRVRKFYEYKGDYRGEIDSLKAEFKKAYGYELMDLNRGWRPDEIRQVHATFAQLPSEFYGLAGLKGFYRASRYSKEGDNLQGGDIPAATYPRYTTVYRQAHGKYRVEIQDDSFRIEFYDPLFSQDADQLINIIHHEMGHAFDLSHGFISFGKEWLQIAGFRPLHIPALDGKADSDFLFALVNDPKKDQFAPVSTLHLPVYSRENPQEDFANSVAAFLHYPYFSVSHPKRYAFLKKYVFTGGSSLEDSVKGNSFVQAVESKAQEALDKKNWEELFEISVEVGRDPTPNVEARLLKILDAARETATDHSAAVLVGRATCYLYHPDALKLRGAMIRAKQIEAKDILSHERCMRVSKRPFEEGQVKWPVLNLYFSRDDNQTVVQFLDPVGLTAYSRGFENLYQWKLAYPEADRPIVQGEFKGEPIPNGAVAFDLMKTAQKKFEFPVGQPVQLEINAVRVNPRSGEQFVSPPTLIRFSVIPGFQYEPDVLPEIDIHYPITLLKLGKK